MMKRLAIFATLAAIAVVSYAQERQPRGTADTMISGKEVVIDYGRPALKGRTVDELTKNLPPDRVWRAGENQVTTLTTGVALKIGGKVVPAGKYSLYIHAPESGNWSLLVNKNLGVPLGELWAEAPPEMAKEPWPALAGYDDNIKGEEVTRIELKKVEGKPTDVFTIMLNATKLQLSWGDLSWEANVSSAS